GAPLLRSSRTPPTLPTSVRYPASSRRTPMANLPERIETELLFEAHIQLAPPEPLGATPFGGRSIFIVTGGTFEGPRLRGTFRPGGGDWYLALANGAGELDVRGTMQTEDGALILLTYRGVLDVSRELAGQIIAGEGVTPSRYYFR